MPKPLYDYDHEQERVAWNQHLETDGPIQCRRCGQLVYCDRLAHLNRDGRKFDLGHPDPGQTTKEPEHNCCNRKAGGREGRRRQLQPSSREWW